LSKKALDNGITNNLQFQVIEPDPSIENSRQSIAVPKPWFSDPDPRALAQQKQTTRGICMKIAALFSLFFFPGLAMASSTCKVDTYKPVSGVTIEQRSGAVSLPWEGESNEQLQIKQVQPPSFAGVA
jgi:hypothetical protein